MSTVSASQRDAQAFAAGFIDARARYEFFAMCAAGFLFSVTHNYSALFAIVFERAGHSLAEIGLLLSLFAIPAIAAALLSSAAVARFGALRTARWSILLTLVGVGSLAFTRDHFVPALLSRIVQAAGVGMFLPAGMVYIQSRITRANFVYFVTVFSAGIPLAAAVAPPLGAWTLERFGATALFLEAAAPAALGIALTYGLRVLPSAGAASGLALSGAFRNAFILPYAAVLMGGALYGFSVSYLAADLHGRAIALAAFFVPSSIAMVAVRFVGMRWMAKLRPPLLVAASLLIYGLAFVLIAVAREPIVMAAGGVAFGLGNSIMFPVVSAWLGEGLSPAERAGPQAVGTASFYFGIYAIPLPQTFMIGAWGFFATEIIFAIAAVAMAATVVALARRPSA